MDRSYIEYSRIVESFISRSGENPTHSAVGRGGQLNQDGCDLNPNDPNDKVKLAFLNVLREEMT